MANIIEELHRMIDQLSPQDQERMLTYVRELTKQLHTAQTPLPPGTHGSAIADLRVTPEGGEAMEQALADTERIDVDCRLDYPIWNYLGWK